MAHRWLQPDDEPTLRFVLDCLDDERVGEADDWTGLVALLVGPEYEECETEEARWHLRADLADGYAIQARLMGQELEFVGSESGLDPSMEESLIRGLVEAGLIEVYERRST